MPNKAITPQEIRECDLEYAYDIMNQALRDHDFKRGGCVEVFCFNNEADKRAFIMDYEEAGWNVAEADAENDPECVELTFTKRKSVNNKVFSMKGSSLTMLNNKYVNALCGAVVSVIALYFGFEFVKWLNR